MRSKYRISYYEDEYNCVAETEVECEESEIKEITDKYYLDNLRDKDISGANWNIIE